MLLLKKKGEKKGKKKVYDAPAGSNFTQVQDTVGTQLSSKGNIQIHKRRKLFSIFHHGTRCSSKQCFKFPQFCRTILPWSKLHHSSIATPSFFFFPSSKTTHHRREGKAACTPTLYALFLLVFCWTGDSN